VTATREGPLLLADGARRGDVYVSPGHPAWLTMTVGSLGKSGTVQCRITTNSGKSYVLGTFTLSNGHGTWGSAIPVSSQTVARAEVVSTDGQVLATAHLTD